VTIKIGYKASAEQFGPQDLLRFTVLAEKLGYDNVAISDHLQPWRHHGGHAPFSLAWLGAVGQATSKIGLGTSVVTPTFRYHPGVIAHAFATLACLFPGRVWLGIGTGEAMNEVPLGIEWPGSQERFARLKEAAEVIQKLWREERVSYDGSFYSTRNATIYDRPEVPPQLYIAASGASAARLAGRVADGLICTSGKDPSLYSDVLLPALVAGEEKGMRKPFSVDRAIEMKVSYDSDHQRALEDTRNWGALALTPEEKVGVEDPLELERLSAALSTERCASRWVVSSKPEDHVEAVRRFAEMGFDNFMFHFPGDDQERALELFARDVMPGLQTLEPARQDGVSDG